MMLYFYIFTFLLSFISLGVASGLVANAFVGVTRVLGINEYIITFILVGAATSLPEIFVSVASFITNSPAVSVGNVIGANLANITLVLGIVAFLAGGIDIGNKIPKKIFWVSFVLALLPSVLVFGGGINRLDGVVLCLIFLAYVYVFVSEAELFEKPARHLPYGVHFFSDLFSNVKNLIIGLALLSFSALFIVFFGSSFADYLSLNTLFFSTIFLGLVTTLPELLFGIRSAILNHPALAMGNILGSVVFNSTVIPGVLSILSTAQTTISNSTFLINSFFTFIAFFFLSIFSYSGSKISRNEGLLLILLYVLFFISYFML
ncbi:MAG: sodium:calcium antiporter [Candidatus Vogelbacteria bacterium]|nr:sodium:calcium antiporter [Candidatus Vogelbacteria bacterium]